MPQIYADAKKMADELGIPPALRGKLGLAGANGVNPDPLPKADGSIIGLVEEIREIVKVGYGDEWDAVPVNSAEAALWVACASLLAPPSGGWGQSYRARFIVPYGKALHHLAGFGCPFPPKYKDLWADRGTTAGELGLAGKRLPNLDAVIVPLAGAEYPVHGIKSYPVPFLTGVEPAKAIEQIALAAEVHEAFLAGFAAGGYDTPGYGAGMKDEDGVPLLGKHIGELAQEYDVPFIVDNSRGTPFVGTDPRLLNAGVMVYSGLVIGREGLMVNIRRALGLHGDRWGTTATYGPAGLAGFRAGKTALDCQLQVLQTLRETPEMVTRQVDALERIVQEEFSKLNPVLQKGIVITKSYNSRDVEVNYEATWQDGGPGFPVFTVEDMYAGSNIIQTGLAQMGILPAQACEASIRVMPGPGTVDPNGDLVEENLRYAIQALVQLLEIIGGYAGLV